MVEGRIWMQSRKIIFNNLINEDNVILQKRSVNSLILFLYDTL